MTGQAPPGALALVAAGRPFRLPPGARPVALPSDVRPLPGDGPPELQGIAMLEGRIAPVWALDPEPAAWVALEGRAGPVLLGGAALLPALPGTPLLAEPAFSLTRRPARRVGPAGVVPTPPPREPPAPVAPATLILTRGEASLAVSLVAMEGLRPMPDRCTSVPGAPTSVLGYAETLNGLALVLDPRWAFGEDSDALPPALIALLVHAGRRIAIPCDGARPGVGEGGLAERLDGTPEGQRALELAPAVHPAAPPPPPRPMCALLLCRAGTLRFAMQAEEVAAVVAPQRVIPAPRGAAAGTLGVCLHRGEVLPVLGSIRRLGGTTPEPGAAQPLLRLALPRPVAVPVNEVLGLQRVPEDDLTPVPHDPLLAALTVIDGSQVMVCRAAGLAEARA